MKKISVICRIGKVEQKENCQILNICVNEQKKENGEYVSIEWWGTAIIAKDVKINVGDRVYLHGNFNIEAYMKNDQTPAARLTIFVNEYEVLNRQKTQDANA